MDQSDNKKPRPFWLRVTLNIVMMIAVACLVLWLSTFVLDFWTRHGKNVKVPDVKGLHYDKAYEILTENDFEVVLQDSVYEKGIAPGTVVEQNPKDSVEVKPGRTIFLTINAFYPQTAMVPAITDISVRQARTILEGLGIKNIQIKQVQSEYTDLVLAATYQGKRLNPGMRVPLTAKIVLEVGVGLDYNSMRVDTLNTVNNAVADPAEEAEGGEDSEPATTTETPAKPTPQEPSTPTQEPEIDPDLFD